MADADKDTSAKRSPRSKQKENRKCRGTTANDKSSQRKRALRVAEEPQADWMSEEDAQFVLSILLSGRICRPTPFAEIAKDCPAVWRRALEVFNYKEAARTWLETRSPIFDGRRPISVAMQIGGSRKVLQQLKKLLRAKVKRDK